MKQWLRKVYFGVSPAWRLRLRKLYYLPIDFVETITGKRDDLTPPKGLIFTGSGDFKKQGESFLKHFIQLGGVQANHSVLDVGSGLGRMAIPFTKYLNAEGQYEGFDIMPEGVNWCNKHIKKQFPNFNFTCVPLTNTLYTNKGRSADSFVFPYADNQFDFVFLTSVFTHMLPKDVAHYLGEIDRVLKPNGTCFATFFYLDEETIADMNQQENPFFKHKFDNYYLHNLKVPEANVGYTPQYFSDVLKGKTIELEHIYKGWWSGREKQNSTDFQDILIFKKT